MKSITYEQFKDTLPNVVSDVLCAVDIVRVDTGRDGAFVVIGEPEYNFLRNALRAVFAIAGSVNVDEKTIDVEKLLEKLDD